MNTSPKPTSPSCLSITTMVGTCLMLCFLIASFAVAAQQSPDQPAPREQWWLERQETHDRQIAQAGSKAEIVFIGDSITEGWAHAGQETWQQRYAPRGAINLGVGGDQTQHVLWRLDHANLAQLRPRLVVLMIGTNNIGAITEGNSTVAAAAGGIAAVVGKIREKLPEAKVLLVAILPRGEHPNSTRGVALQINQIVRHLVDDRQVHWLDIGHLLVDRNGDIPPELMADFLHLTPRGYALWGEAMEASIAKLLAESQPPAQNRR